MYVQVSSKYSDIHSLDACKYMSDIRHGDTLSVISALGKQRQEDSCKFGDSLDYVVSSRLARAAKTKQKQSNKPNKIQTNKTKTDTHTQNPPNPTFAQYLNAITRGTSLGSSFPRAIRCFVVRQAFSFPALTLQRRPLVGEGEGWEGKEKKLC